MAAGEKDWRFAREDPEFHIAAQRSEWTKSAQHISVRSGIDSYLPETYRVLGPERRAVVPYDSASRRLWQRLAQRLPDRMLSRTQRSFFRRWPIPADELAGMIRAAGLEILEERGRGTREHEVLLGRDPAARGS